MRYKKGTFVVVPNKNAMAGQKPIVQVVFFWLCAFADEDGVCFPSRTTIARLAGCSVPSVDEAINTLVSNKILTKTTRKKDKNQNLSNLYQIEIVEGGSKLQTPPSKLQTLGGGQGGLQELYPYILTQSTELVGEAELRVESVKDSDQEPRQRHDKRRKDKELVYRRFSNSWQPWWNFKQERDAALILFDRGLEKLDKGIALMRENEDDQFCPKASTPFEYLKKLPQLNRYSKKNT